jgi:hypothetical protein
VNRAHVHGVRLYHERLFLGAPFLGTVLAETDDLPRVGNRARPAWRFEAGYQSAQSTQVIKRRLSAPFARIPCFNFCFGQNHVEKLLGEDSSQLILSGKELAEFWSAERSHLRRGRSAILTNSSVYRLRCQEYAVFDTAVKRQAGSSQCFCGFSQHGFRFRRTPENRLDSIWQALRVNGRTDKLLTPGGYGERGQKEQHLGLGK